MVALVNDLARLYAGNVTQNGPELRLDAVEVFEGSALGDNAGFVRSLVVADAFRGFARTGTDNSGGAAGDLRVDTFDKGRVRLDVVGVVDEDDIGQAVYATDDNLFTLTRAASPSFIGRIIDFLSGTEVWVEFDVARGAMAGNSVLTDNSGGAGVDGTIGVITNAANPGSADVAPTADAIAELADKINFILEQMQ